MPLASILCIADDEVRLLRYVSTLRAAGYRVQPALGVQAGRTQWRRMHPALVVCEAALARVDELPWSVIYPSDGPKFASDLWVTSATGSEARTAAPADGVLIPEDRLLATVSRRLLPPLPESATGFLPREQLLAQLAEACRTQRALGVVLLKLDSFLALTMQMPDRLQRQLERDVWQRVQPLAEQGRIYQWSAGCWAWVGHPPPEDAALRALTERQILTPEHGYTTSVLHVVVHHAALARCGLDIHALMEACALHLNFESAGQPRRLLRLDEVDYHALEAARYAGRNLAAAIHEGELELVFQPRVDLQRHRIVGAEALLRWPGASIGGISPALFVPAAERMGMAAELDRWVVDAMLAAARQFLVLRPDFVLSFNLSGQSLDAGLASQLYHRLQHEVVLAANLEIEITETSMASLTDEVEQDIAALRQMGIRLAVDDFGMGYASLAYLKRLRAEVIKIDRSFVDDMMASRIDCQIIEGLLGLARAVGCTVVAEGVESAGQADRLADMGCHQAQGYHFFQPMPTAALCTLLAAGR